MVDREEEFYERITSAIEGSVSEGDFVTKWVMVMEVIDPDGDRGAYCLQSKDGTVWDVLGLLDYAKQRNKARVDMHTWATTQMAVEDDDEQQ